MLAQANEANVLFNSQSQKWQVEPVLGDSLVSHVFSPSNIAIAKYWGKRDTALNLPTNGSISVSLKDFGSFTTVEFNREFLDDRLILNGKKEELNTRVKQVLDELRRLKKTELPVRVQSFNNFPTGAGLASSASGLSALTFATAHALGLSLNLTKLSEIARLGSGSACRSLFSGYVEWKRGELVDGTDSIAQMIFSQNHFPLKIFIAVVDASQKEKPSTLGMEQTRKTSPYFESWVKNAQTQLGVIRTAIENRDFETLACETEANCLRMHACALATSPPILYWQPTTLEIMHRVWALRNQGVSVFFTIDAGPNVVVFASPKESSKVFTELSHIPRIQLLATEIGEGARLL